MNLLDSLNLALENAELKKQLIEIQGRYLGLQLQSVEAQIAKAKKDIEDFNAACENKQ